MKATKISRRAENLKQLQSKTLFDLIHPKYRDSTAERVNRLDAGGAVDSMEMELIRLDGRTVQVEVFAERKRIESILQKAKDDLEVKVSERTAQLTDMNKALLAEIEERKRSEERLRRSLMVLARNCHRYRFPPSLTGIVGRCYQVDERIEKKADTGA